MYCVGQQTNSTLESMSHSPTLRCLEEPAVHIEDTLLWKSSRKGQSKEAFFDRALLDEPPKDDEGSSFGWIIGEQSRWGKIPGVRRSIGTLQKDWAFLKSNALPYEFCIAVRGHKGWSRDPDSAASYALTVTFESLGEKIRIYEPLRAAVNELQAEVELEEFEIEIDEA